MSSALPALAPQPPPPGGLKASPFEGQPNAAALDEALAAATHTVEADPAAKRPRAEAAPGNLPLHMQLASKHRPPRPPSFAESASLQLLDLPPGPVSPPQRPGRSPRSPPGTAAASPGSGRKPGRQLSKTLGRVCIECGASQTTQWRSQGLLCNSCGVKLIKGRLPMDPEAMQRRWLRLPPAIKDHPMWAAAQVVAAAQAQAARVAAAGEAWACPSCGRADQERIAGPCGLHHCPSCVERYQLKVPATGAAAVAAAVTAPPAGALLLPSGALTPPPGNAATPASGHKRRKQAMPRSASAGLSPVSISSSGSSSIQAYSWESAHEEGHPEDAATSKEPRSGRRARRPSRRHTPHDGGAAPVATPPPAAGKASPAGPPGGTPTAAEAAAALLVLTESEELRVHAAEMDRQHAAAIAAAAGAAQAAAQAQQAMAAGAATATAPHDAQQASEQPTVQQGVPAASPSGRGDSGSGAAAAAVGGQPLHRNSTPSRMQVANSLDLVMQLLRKNSSGAALAAAAAAGAAALPPLPPAAAPSPAAAAAAAGSDSVQLYQALIQATLQPGAAAAGLTAELVGRFLAAHTMPSQRLAAAGGAPGSGEAAAVIAQQAQQQAQLILTMAREEQWGAAVALMRSVVQLAGLADGGGSA